jgi:general secretion pathway protein M
MKNMLAGLDTQQRSLVFAGAALLGILILALIWGSLVSDVNRLKSIVADQHELEQWMQRASKEALQLRGVTSGNVAGAGNKSLLALVDETAKQSRLGQAMRRVEPEGQDKVRIQLDGALFDDMAQWLEKLELGYNIHVDRISVDRLDASGFVNARVTMAGAA